MAASSFSLDSLLSLTRELLGSAEAGDWERVTILEGERRPLIHAIFPADAAVGDDSYRRAAIREILEADRQVMDLARQQRDRLQLQLRDLGHGRSALRAYGQNQK
ncbi:MAG: flagellar protein FliT [Pseudomonadota bacterium]